MKLRRFKTPQPTRNPVRRDSGRSTAPVFSYHAQRLSSEGNPRRRESDLDNRPERKPRDWRWLRYLPSWVAGIAILVSFVYLSGVNADPQIELAGMTPERSAVSRDEEVYRQGVQEQLEKSFFSKSKLTIDSNKLADEIKERFPELEQASIALPIFRRRPIVTLRVAAPALILTTANGSFVLDYSGRVMAESVTTTLRDNEAIPTLHDETDVPVIVGAVALPAQNVAFVREIHGQLRAQDLRVESMHLPPLPAELHVKVRGKDYFIKFNFFTDARVAAGSYLAARPQFESSGRAGAIEYVDARVEERIYYR